MSTILNQKLSHRSCKFLRVFEFTFLAVSSISCALTFNNPVNNASDTDTSSVTYVQFSKTTQIYPEGTSGTSTLTLTAVLTSSVSTDVNVFLSFSSSSSTDGTDTDCTDTIITISAGDLSGSATCNINGDSTAEGIETVIYDITATSNSEITINSDASQYTARIIDSSNYHYVNDPGDDADLTTADNICSTAGSRCTLTAAIAQNNSGSGVRSIYLPDGFYQFSSRLTINSQDFNIYGESKENTILDGNDSVGAFTWTGAAANNRMQDLTFQNFHHTGGGGVFSHSISGSVLRLENVKFYNNTATSNGSVFYIGSDINLFIGSSFFVKNYNHAGHGVISTTGTSATISIQTTIFERNDGHQYSIVAVNDAGTTTRIGFSDCYFSLNYNSNEMFDIRGTDAVFERSSFYRNSSANAGGVFNPNNASAQLDLNNSSVINNWGGVPIEVGSGTANLLNTTFYANQTRTTTGGVDGVGGTTNVTNSILFGNHSTTVQSNCAGTITSLDWNISGALGSSCGFSNTNDQDQVNPEPYQLGFFGEWGPSVIMRSTSPAVDTTSAACVGNDQNGATRDANCDLGSTEYQGGYPPEVIRYAQDWYLLANHKTMTTITPTVVGTPTSFSVTPALPAGMSLDTSTGAISGAPSQTTGAFGNLYKVAATNSFGSTYHYIRLYVLDSYTVDHAAEDGNDQSNGNDQCLTAGGNCTLRAAVQEAQALNSPRLIIIPDNMTVELTSILPTISTPIYIRGAGSNSVITRGTGGTQFANLSGMASKLFLHNVTIRSFQSASNGGAITLSNNADLYTQNVTFNSNRAMTNGGALYGTDKSFFIQNTTFSGNSCASGMGGAIWSDSDGTTNSQLHVKDSYFYNNSATASSGGAIHNQSDKLFLVENTTFESNVATNGGAISITGGANIGITNSTFYENRASTTGIALYVDSGLVGVIVEDSTFYSTLDMGETFYTHTSVTSRIKFLDNIIINDSGTAQLCGDDGNGSTISLGYNVMFPNDADCGAVGSDNTAPTIGLDSFSNHGGFASAYSISASATAIDFASQESTGCLRKLDQSYRSRTVSSCDAGAYER